MKNYVVTFKGHAHTYYVKALNEGDAWYKALKVSGLCEVSGHVELLITKKVRI